MNVSLFAKICQVLTLLHQLICRGVANFGTRCIWPNVYRRCNGTASNCGKDVTYAAELLLTSGLLQGRSEHNWRNCGTSRVCGICWRDRLLLLFPSNSGAAAAVLSDPCHVPTTQPPQSVTFLTSWYTVSIVLYKRVPTFFYSYTLTFGSKQTLDKKNIAFGFC